MLLGYSMSGRLCSLWRYLGRGLVYVAYYYIVLLSVWWPHCTIDCFAYYTVTCTIEHTYSDMYYRAYNGYRGGLIVL